MPMPTGSTTSNAIASVSTAAISVVRPVNQRLPSTLRNNGHSAIAITPAHATTAMKSRTTHSASSTRPMYSASEAAFCFFRRSGRVGRFGRG